MTPIPRVVDLYHGDVLRADAHNTPIYEDMKLLAGAGIWGVIHKATQGIGNRDLLYRGRVSSARRAGLLAGAYHFNTGDTPAAQVAHFFDVAEPDGATLMALDWEDNRVSQMSLSDATKFLQLADEQLGRPVWLYSGNRAKELLCNASAEVRQTFGKRHWWLCQYSSSPSVLDYNKHALPWLEFTLWQYTGDGYGPLPHNLPGIVTKGIDINSFAGTREELEAAWVS